jgi:formylglycine-generating enzyme required for sulfatase activity
VFKLQVQKFGIIFLCLTFGIFCFPMTPQTVIVEPGSFEMGNARNDPEGYQWEIPVHPVELTYPFAIGMYLVTFKEYDAYCEATGVEKKNDEGWGRENRPVISVSWWDAVGYCNWVSQREGLTPAYDSDGNFIDREGKHATDITIIEGYRLPTSAEWEYAAREGHKRTAAFKYSGSNVIDDVAWYNKNAKGKTHPVGEKMPNALGIYDMSGNVWEWCHDWHATYKKDKEINPTGPEKGYERVVRGSAYYAEARLARVSNRGGFHPARFHETIGFRIARTVFPSAETEEANP